MSRHIKMLSKLVGVAATLSFASAAHAQTYADPAGSGVFVNAAEWLQGTLLGTFATVAAIIAIAGVGFMMLTGRMNWRHGAIVIVGCFIIFGAASIVAGIQTAAGG
jgi:type IV secretion system protein VirB2